MGRVQRHPARAHRRHRPPRACAAGAVRGRGKKLKIAVGWAVRAKDFAGGELYSPDNPLGTPDDPGGPDDDYWTIPELGIDELRVHPVHLVTRAEGTLIEWWAEWRRHGTLPFAGGVADQPACVMEAMRIIDEAMEAMHPKPPRGGSR